MIFPNVLRNLVVSRLATHAVTRSTILLLIVTLSFTFDEKKIWSGIKKSQNFMTMIIDYCYQKLNERVSSRVAKQRKILETY